MLKSTWLKLKKFILNINLKEDNRPLIFLVCLAIATVLWFVNALGDTYETTVSMPIQYTNLPKEKVLVSAPPKKIQVQLKAHGLTLLRHKLKLSIKPLNFNVKSFTDGLMDKTTAENFKIVSNRYLPQLSRQVSSEISILGIKPDTLYFKFDRIIQRKLPVAPNFEITFENQYFQYDSIHFIPDSVMVTGPRSIVEKMKNVPVKHQRFKKLDATYRRSMVFEDINSVEIEPRRVNVEIPVSQYSEYIADIPIQALNVPDSIKLITFPVNVKISCRVAVHLYQNLNENSFLVYVDYNDLQKESNSKLPVKIMNAPGHIKMLNHVPKEVEFIIEEE